ncbi:MAG: twin-arginine translocase subunit TatC [Bacillota bacterium]|nr:twin-arginine translocase subunit TatC [Bacillota bacterium]
MERKELIRLFEDLRKRLIIITVVVFVFAVISFTFSDYIRHLMLIPGDLAYSRFLGEGHELQLIFLTPSEALLANIRLAFITSATVTLPIILYQLLAIVTTVVRMPRRSALILTLIMYVLFAMGIAFAYFVVLPFALNFFIGFSGPDLVPNFSFARYIAFITSFVFSFGLVFQLPVLFWFLGSIGLVNTGFLRKNRKFALLIIVIFSAVLTPPDIFSQVLMAIPLMMLYELGIFMVYLAWRKKARRITADTPEVQE